MVFLQLQLDFVGPLGFEQARKQLMKVGFDPRPVMGSVYALYRGDDDAKYIEAGRRNDASWDWVTYGGVHQWRVPQNGWFIRGIPTRMDDLRVPSF